MMWWWIIGMPVLWYRRMWCRIGVHAVEDYGVTGFGDHCMRCFERMD